MLVKVGQSSSVNAGAEHMEVVVEEAVLDEEDCGVTRLLIELRSVTGLSVF